MRERMTTVILAVVLLVLSVVSLFVGVMDITPAALMSGDIEQLEIFLISRLPRLLAILCTGVGMSVAGLIMQQLRRLLRQLIQRRDLIFSLPCKKPPFKNA